MDEFSKNCTAFSTPFGSLKLLSMPKVLISRPLAFQRLVKEIVVGVILKICVFTLLTSSISRSPLENSKIDWNFYSKVVAIRTWRSTLSTVIFFRWKCSSWDPSKQKKDYGLILANSKPLNNSTFIIFNSRWRFFSTLFLITEKFSNFC